MKQNLSAAVAQLPDAIARGAPLMIGHIIESMQIAIARDAQLPNVSYCSLLLKLGANDMAREFSMELKQAVAHRRKPKDPGALPSAFGLLLEPIGAADPSVETMQNSTELFGRVLAKTEALGINGLQAYGKEFFLAPLREAMVKARIDEDNIARMMPYACRALDAELARLYERLDAVT